MKNIVVVGGGTAGWLTALYLKKLDRYLNIIVVKSDKIGILGAGEGSTPQFTDLLHEIDISEYELIRHTNATYKLGINFENWHGDNTSYFHGFGLSDRFKEIYVSYNNDIIPNVIKNNLSLDEYYMPYKLALKCKAPFLPSSRFNFIDSNSYENYSTKINYHMDNTDWVVGYSLHFDAVELSHYFEKIAIQRDITVIEGIVENINLDDEGYIDHIIVNRGNNLSRINTDFVFDCTGFHKLIIGKKFESNWVSLKDYLPMKQAQPFFLPANDNPHPWTQAIAQSAGWIWKIPLQHRYGCGYVYDTDYIDNNTVKAEILKQYPDAEIPDRVFKFDPGYFETPLVKNCFAIGLANSFVEPLEATSIFSFINQLKELRNSNILNLLLDRHARINAKTAIKKATTSFNEKCTQINLDIAYFIQFHYLTERNDTKFWKDFKNNTKRFEYINARIEEINYGNLDSTVSLMNYQPQFGPESWKVVSCGLRHLKIDQIHYNNINLEDIKKNIDMTVSRFVSQQDVITLCKS